MFSSEPVPQQLIEVAVLSSTAPSGAHKQPWTFVATQNRDKSDDGGRRRTHKLPRKTGWLIGGTLSLR